VEPGVVALVVGVIIATSPVKRNFYQATLIGDLLILEKIDFPQIRIRWRVDHKVGVLLVVGEVVDFQHADFIHGIYSSKIFQTLRLAVNRSLESHP
jgi:hypothetical protein